MTPRTDGTVKTVCPNRRQDTLFQQLIRGQAQNCDIIALKVPLSSCTLYFSLFLRLCFRNVSTLMVR